MNAKRSGCRLLVIRAAGLVPDAWDRRPAVVAVDGVDQVELQLGEEAEFLLSAGEHEIAIRLLYYFAPASITVTLKSGQTTILTCSKGSSTFLDLLRPRDYWQLTVATEQPDVRRSRFEG